MDRKTKKGVIIGSIAGGAGIIAGVIGLIIGLTRGTNTPPVKTGYTIRLDAGTKGVVQGSTVLENQMVVENAPAVEVNEPTLYKFDGWYSDDEFIPKNKISFPYTPSSDTTLYANYNPTPLPSTFVVNFNVGEGATPVSSVTVTPGQAITRPVTEFLDHDLISWHDGSLTGPEVFKFNGSGYNTFTPSGTTTVYAKWKQTSFKVDFYTDGGTMSGAKVDEEYAHYHLEHQRSLESAPSCGKEGSTFLGWFKNTTDVNPVSFPLSLANNTSLYAKWDVATPTYTLTFNANGGKFPDGTVSLSINAASVQYSPSVSKANSRLVKGSNNSGWYDKNNNEIKFPIDTSKMQQLANQTLTAKWEQHLWDVKVYKRQQDVGDPSKVWQEARGVEDYYAPNENPIIDDYIFDHYHDVTDDKDLTPEIGKPLISNLTKDHVLYAVYKQTKFTLHIKYFTDQSAATDIATMFSQDIVSKDAVETISKLAFDDPQDTSHHTRTFDKIYGNSSGTDVVYDPNVQYNPRTLTSETTWYVSLKTSHFHIWLHYWKSTEVYNPNDFYPTHEYDETTVGFTQRGQPAAVTNYEFLGWQLLPQSGTVATATTKEECLYGVGESARDDTNGNRWPVIPDQMKIGGNPAPAQEWHLHPIYKLTDVTFHFFDTDGTTTILDPVTTKIDATGRTFATPEKEHFNFLNWYYVNQTTIKINGQEVTRAAGALFAPSDYSAEFTTPDVSLKASWKESQYMATFYLSDSHETGASKTIWYDVIEGTDYAQVTDEGLPSDIPTTTKMGVAFMGWSLEKKDTYTRSDIHDFDLNPVKLVNNNQKFYPAFIEPDYDITVYFAGGTWKPNFTGNPVPCSDSVTIGVFKGVGYTSENLTNLAREAEIASGKPIDETYYLTGTTDNPNFTGWCPGTEADIIRATYYFTDESPNYITAIYADLDNITVTFNASGGDFVYTDNSGETFTNNILLFDLSLSDFRSKHSGYVRINDVFTEATKEIPSVRSEISFSRDGYKLNEGKIVPGEDVYYTGWTARGAYLPTNYEITTSITLVADWVKKTPTSWETDDWGTIVDAAEQGYTYFTQTAYSNAYQSNNKNGDIEDTVSQNKAKNTLVGLEKEIVLPGLSKDKFTTRVIGVNQDHLVAGGKALMTFDFVDCPITATVGSHNDYINGDLNRLMATILKSTMTYTMRNALKAVTKGQIVDDSTASDDDAYHTATFNNYMFAESTYEVNGGTANPSSVSSYSNSSARCESIATGSEFVNLRFVYDWYKYKYEDGTKNAESTGADRVVERESVTDMGHTAGATGTCGFRCKYKGATNDIATWTLRTPAISGIYCPEQNGTYKGNTFYVAANDEDSGKPRAGGIWDFYSSNARYFSPTFCLGSY